MTTILIIGGGFAGCEAARRLAKMADKNVRIQVLEPKTHFEYHGSLYRFATGTSPLETCIPYSDIFAKSNVELVKDACVNIDTEAKKVFGASGCTYGYDTLLIGIGSAVTTFAISGVREYSFGMRNAVDAHQLQARIDGCLQQQSENVVVVGGGASGVELAGEIACYAKQPAVLHRNPKATIQVHLVEAAKRILPELPESAAAAAMKRLSELGVDVLISRKVVKEEPSKVILDDREIVTSTVVWTAGICGHDLLKRIPGVTLDARGRVEVDECLRARGTKSIFVLGDSAATPLSGMAQTALYDGLYVSRVIDAERRRVEMPRYQPPLPVYAVPVGGTWAVVVRGTRVYTGKIGWFLRRLLDLKVFLRMLPLRQALRAFRYGGIREKKNG